MISAAGVIGPVQHRRPTSYGSNRTSTIQSAMFGQKNRSAREANSTCSQQAKSKRQREASSPRMARPCNVVPSHRIGLEYTGAC